MELLVVVAIIGVLVAIAIPLFASQLERSREATDLANIRSAYALVATKMLDDPDEEYCVRALLTLRGYKRTYGANIQCPTPLRKCH